MNEPVPPWQTQLLERARRPGWGEPGGGESGSTAELPACEPAEQMHLDGAIRAWLGQAIDLKLLRLDWCSTDGDGKPKNPVPTVTPAGKVGFTTTSDGQFLEVRPKINDADYLALLLLAAGEDDGMKHEHAAVLAEGERPDSLVELLVVGLVDATEKLVQRIGLRRQHRRVEETLRARLRSTVDVPRYLTRFASGRPLDIPCRFERHEVDTLPNRTLLWAVRLARGVLDDMSRLGEWRDRARRLERHFEGEGVELTPIRPGDLRGLERLPPGFAPYERPLAIARLLIRDLTPTIAGGKIKSISLAIDLADVFEDAFANLCRVLLPGASVEPQEKWFLSTRDPTEDEPKKTSRHMRPDVVVRHGKTTLVMDTKWKSVIDRAIDETDKQKERVRVDSALSLPSKIQNVRFNYGDLYQMWSYLHVAEAREPAHVAEAREPERTVVGALVYPVAIKGKAPVPVEVFPTETKTKSPQRRLYLVPWNVHRDVFHSTGKRDLKDALDFLLTEQQ